jgi:GTP-binding protein
MTQTKFVLTKALNRNLKPLVVMNKIDRPSSRPAEVEDELLYNSIFIHDVESYSSA